MANPAVKCTVQECTHYMSGDQCMAGTISIYNDEKTGESHADDETECKSFHRRGGMGDMIGALHNANIGGVVSAPFSSGKQITPGVQCFVNQCVHWEDSNMCHAESIEINGPNAAEVDDTKCNTFKNA